MAEVVEGRVRQWGNSLALRLPSDVAKVAGVAEDSAVKITAEPGRVIIETLSRRPSLEEMLRGFDPHRHSGEAMAFTPAGRELI